MGEAVVRPLGLPGDLGWVIMRHGEIYADEMNWDMGFEVVVARIVADFGASVGSERAENEQANSERADDGQSAAGPQAAWIATLQDQRVGCVFLVARNERVAQMRILLVDPVARGQRLGARLVDTCVRFATSAGYERITLWTKAPMLAARSIYLAAGFVRVAEEPHPSYGADVAGQTYELDLLAPQQF